MSWIIPTMTATPFAFAARVKGPRKTRRTPPMSKPQLLHAAGLGLLFAAAYIGLTFGADIARFRHMARALEAVDSCATAAECESAWAELRAAKGGR